MNITPAIARLSLLISFACGCFAIPASSAAGADTSIPAIIQDGFKSWAAKDASYAYLDVWKRAACSRRIRNRRNSPAISAGWIICWATTSHSKPLNPNPSAHPRGLFTLPSILNTRRRMPDSWFTRTDKAWVIQNMDFSPRRKPSCPGWHSPGKITGNNFRA